jgi:hypothetical protein
VTQAPAESTESKTENERGNLLRQAYGKATARLREAHRDEFDGFYEEEAKALGVDYKRKPSAEEKAREQIAALLAEHPHLAEQFGVDTQDGESEGAEVKQFSTGK